MWKKLLSLGYPVMVGGLAQSLVNTVDLAMVGRLGDRALSSVGIGATTIWIITSSLGSIQIGTQAMTARRFGQDGIEGSLQILVNSLYLSITLALPVSVFGLLFSKDILFILTSSNDILNQGIPYLQYRFIGLSFVLPAIALKGFFNGIGETVIYMKAALLINILNLVLDYILIFGIAFSPALGVKGAAIASIISFFVAILYLFSRAYNRGLSFSGIRDLQRKSLSTLCYLSLYPALQVILTSGGIWVFLRMADKIGSEELALSNILLQILSLTFLLGISLGIASVTLMGKSVGVGRSGRLEEIGWTSFKVAAFVMGGCGLLLSLFPEEAIGIFTNEEVLILEGKNILFPLGLLQVFWAMGITLSYVLQGLGDSRAVLLIEIFIHWLFFLPLSYILAFPLGYDLHGLWAGFSSYIILLGIAMGWRFHKGIWKKRMSCKGP